MELMTKEHRAQLLANGQAMAEADISNTVQPVVKLFMPDGAATWLLAWREPEDMDIAWGLCCLGMQGKRNANVCGAAPGCAGASPETASVFCSGTSQQRVLLRLHVISPAAACGSPVSAGRPRPQCGSETGQVGSVRVRRSGPIPAAASIPRTDRVTRPSRRTGGLSQQRYVMRHRIMPDL